MQFEQLELNENLAIHSCRRNMIAFDKILKHGIVPQKKAKQLDIGGFIKTEKYTASDKVSLIDRADGNDSQAYFDFSKKGVAFVIDKRLSDKKIYAHHEAESDMNFMDGEALTESVDLSAIVGVIIPKEQMDTPMSQLPYKIIPDPATVEKYGADKGIDRIADLEQLFATEFGIDIDTVGLQNDLHENFSEETVTVTNKMNS